jgi:hypothetical protein
MRPICPVCNKNPRAPAYYRNDKRYFRSRCNDCIRRSKNVKPQTPRWQLDGYKKKMICDLCKFKAKYSSQITVWHINGRLNDTALTNLRSVCLCCVEEVKRKLFTWRLGDLEVDS